MREHDVATSASAMTGCIRGTKAGTQLYGMLDDVDDHSWTQSGRIAGASKRWTRIEADGWQCAGAQENGGSLWGADVVSLQN